VQSNRIHVYQLFSGERMVIQNIDRRHDGAAAGSNAQPMSEIVTTSLLVQRRTGTIGAIEYLKAHGVHGAVIQRVLSGKVMRAADAQALDLAAGAAV
jgi:hypothetical protein